MGSGTKCSERRVVIEKKQKQMVHIEISLVQTRLNKTLYSLVIIEYII